MKNGNELSQLLPGQPLRVGVDLIADKNSGAVSYTHLTLPTKA